jgi:uncharacterized protein YdhG (YjbR/CyaY superfamily)
MLSRQATAPDVPAYISAFPAATRKLLRQMRKCIREAAPGAQEMISYGMPAYKLDGVLVYFAGYEKHIGFYPTASGVRNFIKELGRYKTSKGAIQFPLTEPIPAALVQKIVTARVKENAIKTALRKKK